MLASFNTLASAQGFGEDERIKIWDNATAPHSNLLTGEQQEHIPYRVSNITEAELLIYAAKREDATGQAVVICPGGGYALLSMDMEGILLAEWFQQHGITAAVLKYRLPNGVAEVPMEDAREALAILRSRSSKYNFSSDMVGIAGASAGGHLAAATSTLLPKQERPNFSILLYPVITPDKRWGHQGSFKNLLGDNPTEQELNSYSPDRHIDDNTPPAFIVHCDDDKSVSPINSTLYYNKLKEHGVDASLHIYPSGGHGWGTMESFKYHKEWRETLAHWLTLHKHN